MRFHRRQFLSLLACPLIDEAGAAQGELNAYAFSFAGPKAGASRSPPVAASRS